MLESTKIALVIAAGLIVGGIANYAHGETILGHEESCDLLARNAAVAAHYRDAGEPWEKIKESAKQHFTESLGQEKALAKDADDIEIIMGTLEFVFVNPGMDAQTAYDYTLAACARAGTGRRRAALL